MGYLTEELKKMINQKEGEEKEESEEKETSLADLLAEWLKQKQEASKRKYLVEVE